MLEGFKIYDMCVGPIFISITSNGLAFNKTAVVRMEKCEYVTLLIDEIGKRIAIQKASKDTPGTIKFLDIEKKTVSVRWNNKDLLNTLAKMMSWDLSQYTYRVEGEYWSEDEAIIFDLNNAKISETSK